MGYLIAGIDPGSTNMGLAFMEVDIETLEIYSIEAVTLTANSIYAASYMHHVDRQGDLTANDRIKLLLEMVIMKLHHYQPNSLSLEQPFHNRLRPAAYGPLLSQVNTIKRQLRQVFPWMYVTAYPPLSIKKAVGATSSAVFKKRHPKVPAAKGKELVKAAVLEIKEIRDNCKVDINTLGPDAIDAIAICYTRLVEMRDV